MTPGEFLAAVEGARGRDDRRREDIAWATCFIINYCSERLRQGQTVRPSDMLGEDYTRHLEASLEAEQAREERKSVRARRAARRGR